MKRALVLAVMGNLLLAELAAAPPPAPKPDFSSFLFYTGTWTCAQVVGGALRSPHTAVTRVGMNGTWMIEHDTSRVAESDKVVTGTRYLTYDQSIMRWVEVGVNSSGGYWTASSPGWRGNTIVFTTKGLDGSIQFDVITKDSSTRRHDDSHGVDAKGNAFKGSSRCVKLGP
jgi:hypothetical protein